MGDGLDTMKFYKEKSKIRHGTPTNEVALSIAGEIVVGKFVDRERPEYLQHRRQGLTERLGERFHDNYVCEIEPETAEEEVCH